MTEQYLCFEEINKIDNPLACLVKKLETRRENKYWAYRAKDNFGEDGNVDSFGEDGNVEFRRGWECTRQHCVVCLCNKVTLRAMNLKL